MSLSRWLAATLLIGFLLSPAIAQEPKSDDEETGKRTTITALPEIPRAIHDAMQAREYGEAVKQIETELAKPEIASKDYLIYLQGVARTEAGQYDEALATFDKLIREYPEGRWVSRARFGKANVHVLRRRYIEAGEIYGKEAERLLSRGRKDDLAQIYLDFADRYFDGLRADDPSREKQPDYQQALTFYVEAVKLGPTVELKQRIEFRIARCQQELGQNDQAIASYQQFLKSHGEADPTSGTSAAAPVLAEVRYQLGRTQLAGSQPVQARRTWIDFLNHWEEHPDPPADVRELLSQAEYRLAHTYGLPNPPTIGDLELGVTLAERFLDKYPDHPLAAVAELEIAQGFAKHARHQQAVKRLRALIDNPAYAEAKQIADARQMLGQEYLRQAEFDAAIAAWNEFLNEHPTDPQWPQVQKRIVDTEFARADAARARKEWIEARKLLQTFLNKYPLDPRAPTILLTFGQMKSTEASEQHQERIDEASSRGESAQSVELDDRCKKLFEEAISDWRRVVSKYPKTDQASRASLMIGMTLENRLGQLAEALESYQQVQGRYASEAKRRIARLTSPQLQLMTERKFRSDEKPRIRLTSRNLKKVTVRTYQIDMADYFRKMHLASGIESLDIALIDPDQQFEYSVDGFEDYKQLDNDIEIPGTDGAGVTAVTVSSDKLEATTMVVVSDLDMIVKSSRNELFLFVQDMLAGKPASDVSVLISDGSSVFAEEITSDDGTLQKTFEELKSVKDLRVFAIREGHVASTVSKLNGLDFAVGLSPRGYLYSDRPAYRSGQIVNIRGIVRWVDQDRFTFQPDTAFTLDVYDARGRQLQSEEVRTNAYGAIQSNVLLPKEAAQGEYRVQLHRKKSGDGDSTGDLSFETTFQVTEYQLEPVELTIDTEKQVYYRGETVKGTISLKYYYGTPLANQAIEYRFGPDGEVQTAKTNSEGNVEVQFETQRFSESQPLQIRVDYRERGLAAVNTVYLATRGFEISASSNRDVFINGESFETVFKVADPAGEPVATDLQVEVFQQIKTSGESGEKLIATHEVSTDARDGVARQALMLDDGGIYVVRASATDQFGNRVSGEKTIRVSGDQDATRLRILADRLTFEVGDQANVNLHWRESPALALVTFEGARILDYQLVELKQGNNELQWALNNDFAPNVFVTVSVMQRNTFHTAQTEFQVAQRLRIAVRPLKDEVRPGEELEVEIAVTDPQGKPVAAELSLALVESNLLARYSDRQSAIDQFFNAGRRQRFVRQSTSCTFRYAPNTKGVNAALLAEANRLSTLRREAAAWADFSGGVPGNVRLSDRFANDGISNGAVGPEMLGDMFFSMEGQGGRSQRSEADVDGDVSFGLIPQSALQIQSARNAAQSIEDLEMGFRIQQVPEMEGIILRGQQQDVARVQRRLGETFGRDMMRARQNEIQVDFNIDLNFDQTAQFYERGFANGLTAKGRFLTINANDTRLINQLALDEGLQMLPALSRSETAYWDPAIVVDESGKKRIKLTMPERSTAWKLRSKGITSATLAGESDADVITKKELFAEMKLPLALTVGDKIRVPVEVHNSLDGAQSIDVTLKLTMGDRSTELRKNVRAEGPGILDVAFELEIDEADNASFELTVATGDTVQDRSTRIVDIRPYGFPIYETISGTSAQSTVAMIGFDPELPVQGTTLELLIGADVNRSLIESVLGGYFPMMRCGLPSSSPVERSVSDVMGGIGLLEMIGKTRQSDSPQAAALQRRVSSAIAQLLSAQNQKGGWSWNGSAETDQSDPYLTARVAWALNEAKRAGFVVSADSCAKAQSVLQSSLASASPSNLALQAILLHATSTSGAGDFAVANRLYRERNRLDASGRIHLALALNELKRPEMARELVPLIEIPNADKPAADRRSSAPWMRNRAELQALYLLLLQAVSPNAPQISELADALLAARVGSRWPVEKANGPAIAAIARWRSRSQQTSEKYRLTLWVNDRELKTLMIDPAVDGSTRLDVPADWLKGDAPQRVEMKLDGRATFSYSAILTASVAADKIKSSTNLWTVSRRYEPALRIMDGRDVPRGFQVVDGNYRKFSNGLTQLPLGQRAEVTVSPRRQRVTGRNDERYDYLVLTEPIPAGCTILDGSVQGAFERYEIEPGRITFFIGDRRSLGDIRFTLIGYTPGSYRAPQSIVRSFYDPSLFAVANIKELEVLDADSESTDEYRLTPDELYHYGQRSFEKADFTAAHKYLSELSANWLLDQDKQKNVVQWLFTASLALQEHGDTVKFFEEIKEKFPDVEVSFEDILRVAQSYRELAEYERSYLVYRATVEGSFERENQVAGFLNARDEFVRSVEIMEKLLRDYPPESYVATATYALAQETYRRAPAAASDKKLKAGGITRVHLIDSAIRMLDHFVTAWPEDPAADQASFALATALIDLEQFQAAVNRCALYASRYPTSRLIDSYWYISGYSHFELGNSEQALKLCRQVAEAKFDVPETGGTRSADNRWEAIYIMGQIYHSMGQAAQAIVEYTKVKERFADAAEAIRFFNRKEISLEEVTTIRPDEPKRVELAFRNVRQAAIKVYRIDLLKFGLMQRNLDRITAINLAGIKPYHEQTVVLGDGADFADRTHSLELPLKKEGAYLIVCRGDNLYTSGLALVSPLELLVQQDEGSGRVRVSVKNAVDNQFLRDVHVKVIGSANDEFVSGDTDLRGLVIADDIRGTCTVIAAGDDDHYAFFRGYTSLQMEQLEQRMQQQAAPQEEMEEFMEAAPQAGKQILRGNLFQQNRAFQVEQRSNYDNLLNNERGGIKSKEAF